MVNEHLSADEIVWCEQLVQEIAAIVREEKQNDQLSMQNEDGHVITLKYGGITVHVYSEKRLCAESPACTKSRDSAQKVTPASQSESVDGKPLTV